MLIAQITAANKYLAMAVCAGVLISLSLLLETLGKVSPLWPLNQFPDLSCDYSAFAGFAGIFAQFNLLALYWGCFALAIGLFTQRWWLASVGWYIRQRRHLRLVSVSFAYLYWWPLGYSGRYPHS